MGQGVLQEGNPSIGKEIFGLPFPADILMIAKDGEGWG